MKVKKRLDVLLTEQGYAENRTKAQAIIMSGIVYVDGQKADKPGTSYEETVAIEVRGGCLSLCQPWRPEAGKGPAGLWCEACWICLQ